MRFGSKIAAAPLAALMLFAVATSAGDARRQEQPSQCRPSTILAPRVATIDRPVLSVEQNQFFVISLGSNPAAGYHWIVGQAKPYPFGVVGAAIRDGVTVATQGQSQYAQSQYGQYNPYGQQTNQYGQQQYNPYGQQQYSEYQPRTTAGAEEILILKATPPAGVETLEMHYVPYNVTTMQGRSAAPGEVVRQFTIEVTPPAFC
jgi:hypothetical protein